MCVDLCDFVDKILKNLDFERQLFTRTLLCSTKYIV